MAMSCVGGEHAEAHLLCQGSESAHRCGSDTGQGSAIVSQQGLWKGSALGLHLKSSTFW